MSYLPDARVTHIVIHYSATPVERDYSVADIDRMHRKRGFREVGYHYFIRKAGAVETGRDLSQPGRFEMGAHVKGSNPSSIGICFEGGVRKAAPNIGFDSRTPAQIRAMIDLIDKLQERYPGAIVEGHRDMPGAATQCPGFDARAWWDDVLRRRNAPTAQPPARGFWAALLSALRQAFGGRN
ncbi:N-acetylmuramoyl-L-alanine amidase [Palleronia sp. LCG004]|uniref:N-acetylmuramoyl-L-alanine amidase n=1 Tax=Palleronia sp. LCG004 TaxID=3079304 RepID=UPI00294206CF|nr:N-acetylmuramoyl-L-alanine amidase [Palleronia sp. LCG004]WOI54946.1 N-acetylmuramoyl-L-alanine amidase [Palleronia sp. LCG004]